MIARDVTDVREAIRELQESRARLVAAGDAARRRIERNLHDGAQQRLVTVSLWTRLEERRLSNHPETVAASSSLRGTRVGAAGDSATRTGPPPGGPPDHGLTPPSRRLRRARRCRSRSSSCRRSELAPAIEATAYYVVAEALANAAKHTGASLMTVRVAFEDGLLVAEVADDGCGGADENGSGLQGLADRVAAIGSRFAVSSVPDAGTALRAEIPA